MSLKLDHIVIAVHDLESAIADYAALGFHVLRGGDLIQHLPETVGHEGHREVLGTFSEHAVDVKEGTRLEEILGRRHPAVKSSHH